MAKKKTGVEIPSARRSGLFKKARLAMLLKYRTDRGCQRCREKHVACLEFHYRDESTKSFNIMSNGLSVSMETLMSEIAKCDVLCANCHKKLHSRETSGQLRVGRKDAWAKAREERKKTRRPLSGIESGEDIADAIVPELLM